jgi:co-chaperonin GroES (HSP10)
MTNALKRELARLNRPEPIDIESLPVKTMFWRVLVEVLEPKRETDGGIALPDTTIEAEKTLTAIGRVLQLGSFAFKSKTAAGLHLAEEPHLPKVGDYVMYQRYAGQDIDLRSGRKLKVLIDTEVLMLVTDPEQIRNYI